MPLPVEATDEAAVDAAAGVYANVAVVGVSALTSGATTSRQELLTPGALTTAGTFFQQEIPGDLGELFSDAVQNSFISQSLRKSAAENFFAPRNHRYRGVREAWKFNLAMQQLITLIASTFTTLKTKYANLKVSETTIMPSATELAVIYHCREQLRFQEWIVQKDEDKEWFE